MEHTLDCGAKIVASGNSVSVTANEKEYILTIFNGKLTLFTLELENGEETGGLTTLYSEEEDTPVSQQCRNTY